MLEHPEIGWIERTGYPSCEQQPLPCRGATCRRSALCELMLQEDEDEVLNDEDEEAFVTESWDDGYTDWLYDEQRDRALFGDF